MNGKSKSGKSALALYSGGEVVRQRYVFESLAYDEMVRFERVGALQERVWPSMAVQELHHTDPWCIGGYDYSGYGFLGQYDQFFMKL